MSTWIGSSWRTVVSAAVWSAVTSAPGVTADRSTRPEIGAVTVVRLRLSWAAACAAWALARSASACFSVACASCRSCWLTASIFSSSARRCTVSRAVSTAACDFATLARALSSAMR